MKEDIKWANKYFMKSLEIGDVQNETQELAYRTTIDLLDELEKYRTIGTVEQFREAMEKQETKKAEKWNGEFLLLECPKCHGMVFMEGKNCHCTHCGQAVERSD